MLALDFLSFSRFFKQDFFFLLSCCNVCEDILL